MSQPSIPFIEQTARRGADCASIFRTFWWKALPAARPAAAMLGLFTFIGYWTNYFRLSIALGTTKLTLPVALQLLQAGFFKEIPLIVAGVLVRIVPLLVLFLLVGKQMVGFVM